MHFTDNRSAGIMVLLKMNNIEKILPEELQDIHSVDDSSFTRWNHIQKNYFNSLHQPDDDYPGKIKDALKFFQFSLHPDVDELFLRYEEAPVYWLCETKLNNYLKDFFRLHYPLINGVDQFKFIKDYYSKWLLIKQQDEKKYFASSAVNFIEKGGSKNNFINYILCGIIFTYDKKLNNYQKAVELFNKSKEIIYSIKLNEHYREELEYLINLYSGFASIINKKDDIAKNQFLDALTIKPNGISAKFHLALIELKLNCNESAGYLLKEIFHYDSLRIKYAIDNLNYPLLNYFLNNSVLVKIFTYKEFAQISDVLENLLLTNKDLNTQAINDLSRKTGMFNKLNRGKNFIGEETKQVSFIGKVAENYIRINNILLLNSSEKLNSKFNSCIDQIINSIKQKYYSEIQEKLLFIGNSIQERSAFINNLEKEFEKARINMNDNLAKDIKLIETNITEEISLWEERIKNLDTESKLNPKIAFSRTMTYNIVLSFISSLMGGCAGYSSSFVKDVSELKDLFSAIMISGFKWGLITFVVGGLISAAAAAYALLEKSNRKQGIMQKISSLKNEKEHTINELKKEAQRKEKRISLKFNDESAINKKVIEDLIREKEKKEKEYKVEAEKLIEEETMLLKNLIE
jgi:hypothetical protein